MNEEFRDVSGYEGLYQVSNLGNVKGIKTNKILRLKNNGNGYLHVGLSINSKVKTTYVHKLVAITFLDHQPNGYEVVVDHINSIKSDNRLENLQLITQRLNSSKDRNSIYEFPTGVSKNKNAFKANIRINKKSYHLGTFKTIEEASNAYQNALKQLEY